MVKDIRSEFVKGLELKNKGTVEAKQIEEWRSKVKAKESMKGQGKSKGKKRE